MGEAPDADSPFGDLMAEGMRLKNRTAKQKQPLDGCFCFAAGMHYAPDEGALSTAAMTALTRSGESDDLAA